MNDRPDDVPAEPATATIDRRHIDQPERSAAANGTDASAEVLLGMRRRAAWLRLQTRICIVLIAVLLAGGGVAFLGARTIALTELRNLPAPAASPNAQPPAPLVAAGPTPPEGATQNAGKPGASKPGAGIQTPTTPTLAAGPRSPRMRRGSPRIGTR